MSGGWRLAPIGRLALPDVEDLEEDTPSGYHPTIIGDSFCGGRYTVVHKLGFGGYSTIWLARDHRTERYVSLKILVPSKSQDSQEGTILERLANSALKHPGRRFIPPLLDQFFFEGPNGQHWCLVGEPAGCSIAHSKENSTNYTFPLDAARSLAALLIMGWSYLHANDVCHGDLHLHNFLLRLPNLDHLRQRKSTTGSATPSKSPSGAWTGNLPRPMRHDMSLTLWSGTCLQTSSRALKFSSPTTGHRLLRRRPLLQPSHASPVWSTGRLFQKNHHHGCGHMDSDVILYEVLGERPLFETFAWDPDDILGEMINVLGQPPQEWWKAWANRHKFFNQDGLWITNFARINTPQFRHLHQRMWDMGRGETPDSCEWDVAGGEPKALEDLLRAMMSFEPGERPTAEQLLASKYMVK
ncbi:kinase-like domain-containing protein [Aspergillus multicolor]|uniref:kinase-like domain-containing protein n=1 Tax=Aspergillus multicolor TaxID=41759 RepID=UPI003CCD148B